MHGFPPGRGSRRSFSSLPTDSRVLGQLEHIVLELFRDEQRVLEDLLDGVGNLVTLGAVLLFGKVALGRLGVVPLAQDGKTVEAAP